MSQARALLTGPPFNATGIYDPDQKTLRIGNLAQKITLTQVSLRKIHCMTPRLGSRQKPPARLGFLALSYNTAREFGKNYSIELDIISQLFMTHAGKEAQMTSIEVMPWPR